MKDHNVAASGYWVGCFYGVVYSAILWLIIGGVVCAIAKLVR